jgi:hypothetical protein
MGNNSLEIVGLREGRRIQSIAGLKKPRGVAYLPRSNWVCAANSEDGALQFYDAGNYQPKQIIRGLDLADNVRYDSETDLVYAGFGRGGLAVINPSEGQVIALIKLPGHPEGFQLSESKHTLFVNIPDAKQIAVLDLNHRVVAKTWPLESYPSVYPMVLDQPNRRLLVGCRRPARFVALDAESGKVVSDLPIPGEVDDLYFDSKRHRLYACCGEGDLEVIEQTDPDHYRSLGRVASAPGARTAIYSPELDLLAVAVPNRGKEAAQIRLYQPQ